MKYLQKTNVEMIIATTTIAATTATAIIATLGTAGILFASTDNRKKYQIYFLHYVTQLVTCSMGYAHLCKNLNRYHCM